MQIFSEEKFKLFQRKGNYLAAKRSKNLSNFGFSEKPPLGISVHQTCKLMLKKTFFYKKL